MYSTIKCQNSTRCAWKHKGDYQEVRERIPHIGLFTQGNDVAPSSSADIIRALSRYFRGGSVYVVSFRFVLERMENLQRFKNAFFAGYFDYKQGNFGSRHALIHFEMCIGV